MTPNECTCDSKDNDGKHRFSCQAIRGGSIKLPAKLRKDGKFEIALPRKKNMTNMYEGCLCETTGATFDGERLCTCGCAEGQHDDGWKQCAGGCGEPCLRFKDSGRTFLSDPNDIQRRG